MKRRTAEQHERLEQFIFVCTNDRDSEYACCDAVGATETLEAIKSWLRERNAFWSPIGVTTTACLALCSDGGTAITIQPRNEWYSDIQPEDVPGLLEDEFGPNAELVGTSRTGEAQN